MKKLLITLFFLPLISFAAIADDNGIADTSCGGPNFSCDFSFTVTGADTFLACSVLTYTVDPGAHTLSYNGKAGIQIGSQQSFTGSGYTTWLDTFYVIAPDTGSNLVTVTSVNESTKYTHCRSLTGVDQTAPLGNIEQHTETDITSMSSTVTISTANSWQLMFQSSHRGRSLSAGSDTTVPASSNDAQGAIGYEGPLSPGSNTLNINTDGLDDSEVTGFEVKEVQSTLDTMKRGINGAHIYNAKLYPY